MQILYKDHLTVGCYKIEYPLTLNAVEVKIKVQING